MILIRYADVEQRLISVLDDVVVCEQVGENLYLYSIHSVPHPFSI
jgi:hypothetical protein